ncbi:hypothetical protein PsorP6_003410 [Peronosclerospora sorghi]|uniref:Uncharacterized protein n=1 Tax=Peronosclerospora sorghi TaxID=230839 RepID=A0ACC0VNY8_9STRA|nr:hypothetical protein PsorP6_003410 [Peronosclerospora sorghi]
MHTFPSMRAKDTQSPPRNMPSIVCPMIRNVSPSSEAPNTPLRCDGIPGLSNFVVSMSSVSVAGIGEVPVIMLSVFSNAGRIISEQSSMFKSMNDSAASNIGGLVISGGGESSKSGVVDVLVEGVGIVLLDFASDGCSILLIAKRDRGFRMLDSCDGVDNDEVVQARRRQDTSGSPSLSRAISAVSSSWT